MSKLLPLFVLSLTLAAPAVGQSRPTDTPRWEPIPVSARVVDGEGAPRPGLSVLLERAPLEGSPTVAPVSATTDPTGVFRARLPEPGFWRVLLVPDPESPPVSVTLPYVHFTEPSDLGDLVQGAPTRERLGRSSRGLVPGESPVPENRFRLRVVAAETGRPIRGAVAQYAPDMGVWGRSDADGWLTLPHVPRASLVVRSAERRARTLEPGEREADMTLRLEPAVVVSGHAIDGRGAPVEGVRVGGDLGGMGVFDALSVVRTGADGAFVLTLYPRKGAAGVLARHPWRAPAELALVDLADGEHRSGLELVVSAGIAVTGTVVDGRGRPVEGAAVELLPAEDGTRHGQGDSGGAATDGEGRFRIDHRAEGAYDLVATARGFAATWRRGIELEAPREPSDDPPTTDLGVLALDPAARIVGRVEGDDGRPLAGAEVTWLQMSRDEIRRLSDQAERTVRADGDGRFEVVDLVAGVPTQLEVRAAGHLTRGTEVRPTSPDADGPVATDADPLVVVLEAAGGIVGLVRAPDGSPVRGARVSALPTDGGPVERLAPRARAETDDDGIFELVAVRPGRVDVRVEADGFPDAWETVTVTRGVEEVVVTLSAGSDLTGRVVAEDGRPLARAFVVLFPPGLDPGDPQAMVQPGVVNTRADDDGAYRFRGLIPGDHVARVSHERYAPHDEPVAVAPGANRHDFQLSDPGRSVSGRVVAADGSPVGNVGVSGSSLVNPMANLPTSTRTAADGTFFLGGLPAEPVRLSVGASDQRFVRREVDLTDGSIADLELALGGDGRISGRILGLGPDEAARVDLDLGPRGGSVAGVISLDGQPRGGLDLVLERPGQAHRTAHTDAFGRFRLEHVERGAYELSISERSMGLVHRRRVELAPGETFDLDLATASVSGTVVDPETGLGIADVEVRLYAEALLADTDDPFVDLRAAMGRTDDTGRFRIGPVGAQSYRLLFPGQSLAEGQRLDLSSGNDLELTVGMERVRQ
jgi:protocatechuate 3,4-dioxygenase beta subunit